MMVKSPDSPFHITVYRRYQGSAPMYLYTAFQVIQIPSMKIRWSQDRDPHTGKIGALYCDGPSYWSR